MTDHDFIKLNTSITTGSNAGAIQTDEEGNKKAVIELRLPQSLDIKDGIKSVDLQVGKIQNSLYNLPVADVPVDPEILKEDIKNKTAIRTKLYIGFWPYYIKTDGSVSPQNGLNYGHNLAYSLGYLARVEIPLTFEALDLNTALNTGHLFIRRVDTLLFGIEAALANAYRATADINPSRAEIVKFKISLSQDTFFLKLIPNVHIVDNTLSIGYLVGTPGLVKNKIEGLSGYTTLIDGVSPVFQTGMSFNYNEIWQTQLPTTSGVNLNNAGIPLNLICNEEMKKVLNFLPWLLPKTNKEMQAIDGMYDDYHQVRILNDDKSVSPIHYLPAYEKFYVLDSEIAKISTDWTEMKIQYAGSSSKFREKIVQSEWNNVPTILLSPVASVVLLLDGLGVSPQIMPINIQQAQGSSLTTSVPVIENFYPAANSVRDLHDVMLVSREAYSNTALFQIPPYSIQERNLRLRMAYITKDGQMFDLYIPPTGLFSVNLTFCVHKDTQQIPMN